MDRVWEAGTGKVLTAAALRAVKMFYLDKSRVHHDTTRVTVYGDYDLYPDPDNEEPLCPGTKLRSVRAIVSHVAYAAGYNLSPAAEN